MKKLIFVLLLSSLGSLCFADSVFGSVADILEIQGQGGLSFERALKCYELLIIKPSDNVRFLKGFQIEIIISESLKRYSDSFAIDIFANLSPHPSKEQKSYQGERIFSENLPNVNRLFINIPFGEYKLPLSSDIGTFDIIRSLSEAAYPLVLTVQPIIKGVPNDVLNRSFYTTVKPIVEEKGILNLNLKLEEGINTQQFDVLIDNIVYAVNDTSNLVLDAGIHQILINSNVIESQITNFTINAGQTTDLELSLKPVNTTITFDLLDGAVVYLNGNLIEYTQGKAVLVEEGLNTVIIKIGNQKITKKIDVKSGKNYNISLILELEVKEY